MLGGLERARRDLALDPWGNIRIPVLHRLQGHSPQAPFEWVDIPQDHPAFLIGVVYRGIPLNFDGNTTMVVNQSYHRFQCSCWVVEYPNKNPDLRSPWLDEHHPMMRPNSYNKSLISYSDIMSWGLEGKGSTYFAKTPRLFKYDVSSSPEEAKRLREQRHILLGSRGWLDDDNRDSVLSFTTCAVKMEYVQASISCHYFGTSVKRTCVVE